MAILKELFGPSKEEVWEQLSKDIGGEYFTGGFWLGESKVRAEVGEWTVTLDTYEVSDTGRAQRYTRLRAPFVNKDGFVFTIYREGMFREMEHFLGESDVEVGYSEFDEAFVIKGNSEIQLKALFANEELRKLIEEQPDIYFHVKDDEGWFSKKYPEGVDELCFQVHGVIKDLDRLKHLYQLFAVTLHQLCHIGSAYEDDPDLVI
ncbi:MAG TPA: hypothetical protein VIT21_09570 [Chthoniobacterales bacterium]